ncbi:hypothetical protein [Nocardiopsis sp. CC223A]|uniref:hypothetical protein n=1 Tax=Nocardiopsis sp. CC223A TaxID=3044051 RepID=UPI00278C1E2E|nr:hypothetical protein [Nocardiopsis sp. CC223A]
MWPTLSSSAGIRSGKELVELVPVERRTRSLVAPEPVQPAPVADGQDAARN